MYFLNGNICIQVEKGMRRIEQLEAQLKECKAQLARLADEKEEVSRTCDQMRVQKLTRDAETIRLKGLIMGKCESSHPPFACLLICYL